MLATEELTPTAMEIAATEARSEAHKPRRHAIVEPVREYVPLREVSDAAHCSEETVQRPAAGDGAVTVEVAGYAYRLPEQTVELLVSKLGDYANGASARDPNLPGPTGDQLEAAGVLANELRTAMADHEGKWVRLDEAMAFALQRALPATDMTRPSVVSHLDEAIIDTYGYEEFC